MVMQKTDLVTPWSLYRNFALSFHLDTDREDNGAATDLDARK